MMKRSFQSARPDRGSAALTASSTALIALTYGVLRYGFGLQLPRLGAEFGLSSALAGGLAAAGFAAYCLAALVAGRLVGGVGGRLVLWLAAGLAAVGASVVAVAWSTPVLALGVVVAGSAAGAASPALVVAVAATVPASRATRTQAVVNAGNGVGVAVTGVAVLVAPGLWRPVWGTAAVLALVAAAVVDRRSTWPERTPSTLPEASARQGGSLLRPAVAALVAGLGSAAVWTFGRDLVTTTGDLPEGTTAVLWVLLGTAAVLGGLSGDAVRVLGLRGAWVTTAALSGAGTGLLALAPDHVAVVAVAGVLFGGAYTALSGVLIAWAAELRPHAAGGATAWLFVALTAGQAVGAAATGLVSTGAGPRAPFWAGAVVLLGAAAILPARTGSVPEPQASPRRSRIQATVKARSFQAW